MELLLLTSVLLKVSSSIMSLGAKAHNVDADSRTVRGMYACSAGLGAKLLTADPGFTKTWI